MRLETSYKENWLTPTTVDDRTDGFSNGQKFWTDGPTESFWTAVGQTDGHGKFSDGLKFFGRTENFRTDGWTEILERVPTPPACQPKLAGGTPPRHQNTPKFS